MRGLTDQERDLLQISMSSAECACGPTGPTDRQNAKRPLVRTLVTRGLMTMGGGVPCRNGLGSHAGVTTLGKLALELDTIARSGKVEV